MNILVIILFCGALLFCVAMNLSIIYALITGLILFLIYGRAKGFSAKELLDMCLTGIKTVKNILITFMLIGVLTALWRSSGTIAYIVCSVTQLISPGVFVLMTFLLNCLISILIGTSFGTAATIGVICMTMATAMDINPLFIGGAVLSGAFFGDRCSPISTSALLVAQLTDTDIFDNIKNMIKSCIVPFIVTCGGYLAMGYLSSPAEGTVPDLNAIFGKEFALHPVTAVPAAIIIVLSFFKVKVKASMIISILTAVPICIFLQDVPPAVLAGQIIYGFTSEYAEAAMVNGGGVVSMLKSACIVCLSSCYSPIFDKTGLFDGAKGLIDKIRSGCGSFIATAVTSAVAAMLACNQTLAIMLTHQLCENEGEDKSDFALNLEDSVVVISPLVPWSIACITPLTSVGAGTASIFFAFYLMALPLWRAVRSYRNRG